MLDKKYLFSWEEVEGYITNKVRLVGKIYGINSDGTGVICKFMRCTKKLVTFDSLVLGEGVSKSRVGSRVTFSLGTDVDGNIVAEDVIVLTTPTQRKVKILDDLYVYTGSVLRFGKGNCMQHVMNRSHVSYDEIVNHGYTKEDFDCVYVRTVKHQYNIVKSDAPVSMDGKVDDLDALLAEIEEKLVGTNPNLLERPARKFKSKKVKTKTGDKVWAVHIDDKPFLPGSVISDIYDKGRRVSYRECRICGFEDDGKTLVFACGNTRHKVKVNQLC